jgi:GNAT superfamily N-acetyltransferase
MLSISKVDTHANQERLLDFFTRHEFVGVLNARRVFAQGPADLWLAEDAGDLVGALLAVEERRSDGELRGCVENCLVDPERRRDRIARRLMEEAERHYRERGLAGMEFAVRKHFEPNAALLAEGYRIVREYKKDKRDWHGNLIKDQERYVIRKKFEG